MNGYLQPTAAAMLLLLGSGIAGASASAAVVSPMPAPTASPVGAKDKPIVLAQIPDVRIQLGGDRDRDRDRRLHQRDDQLHVIVPRRDHETNGSGRDEHRDRDRNRDSERHDRD